jgi:N-acetylmuramoyl-L-alanine amidase
MVEPGYLTHPDEGPSLADRDVITREAVAIRHGIEAYLARL